MVFLYSFRYMFCEAMTKNKKNNYTCLLGPITNCLNSEYT